MFVATWRILPECFSRVRFWDWLCSENLNERMKDFQCPLLRFVLFGKSTPYSVDTGVRVEYFPSVRFWDSFCSAIRRKTMGFVFALRVHARRVTLASS
jgi:hypothetical protein